METILSRYFLPRFTIVQDYSPWISQPFLICDLVVEISFSERNTGSVPASSQPVCNEGSWLITAGLHDQSLLPPPSSHKPTFCLSFTHLQSHWEQQHWHESYLPCQIPRTLKYKINQIEGARSQHFPSDVAMSDSDYLAGGGVTLDHPLPAGRSIRAQPLHENSAT